MKLKLRKVKEITQDSTVNSQDPSLPTSKTPFILVGHIQDQLLHTLDLQGGWGMEITAAPGKPGSPLIPLVKGTS